MSRWATFDCYGTLIDWNGGIRRELARVFGEDAADAKLARYHELEPELERDGTRTYRQVLTEAMAELGAPPEEVTALADSLPSWPAFPEDTMSIAVVTATQCEGMVLIHEKMFESRLFFVDKLIGMGARIVLCDPHRAIVSGPTQLRGSNVESPDIRAGMAMLIAALCAQGESTINNVGQIERGYERIDERLRGLHAHAVPVRADLRELDPRAHVHGGAPATASPASGRRRPAGVPIHDRRSQVHGASRASARRVPCKCTAFCQCTARRLQMH